MPKPINISGSGCDETKNSLYSNLDIPQNLIEKAVNVMNRQKKGIPLLSIVESPYAGDIENNIKYARACMRDSLLRGEFPLASHLLYTQSGILDDSVEEERDLGIQAGLAWSLKADLHVFYIDCGFSSGMKLALDYAVKNEHPIDVRILSCIHNWNKKTHS